MRPVGKFPDYCSLSPYNLLRSALYRGKLKLIGPAAVKAKIATKRSVARALLFDSASKFAPFVAPLVLWALPVMHDLDWLVLGSLAIAFLSSASILGADLVSFKKRGYMRGLMRHNLRVIDPIQDQVLWKARLVPKKLTLLLAGRYELLDISIPAVPEPRAARTGRIEQGGTYRRPSGSPEV